jgi:hypothetical protein
MLQSRTDLRAERVVQPLSKESVKSLFDDIREDLGLRRRDDKPTRVEKRGSQREGLVAAGFPFASDADYAGI